MRIKAIAALGAALLMVACQSKSSTIDQWLDGYEQVIEKVEAIDVDAMDSNELLKSINSVTAEYDAAFAKMTENDVTDKDLSPEQGEKVNALNARWTNCMTRYNNRMIEIVRQMKGEPTDANNEE